MSNLYYDASEGYYWITGYVTPDAVLSASTIEGESIVQAAAALFVVLDGAALVSSSSTVEASALRLLLGSTKIDSSSLVEAAGLVDIYAGSSVDATSRIDVAGALSVFSGVEIISTSDIQVSGRLLWEKDVVAPEIWVAQPDSDPTWSVQGVSSQAWIKN